MLVRCTGRARCRSRQPSTVYVPYALRPTPYALRPKLPKPYPLRSKPYALIPTHPAPILPKPYTLLPELAPDVPATTAAAPVTGRQRSSPGPRPAGRCVLLRGHPPATVPAAAGQPASLVPKL